MYGSQPWTDRLLELLEEGPVDKEKVLPELIGLVPPGHAWRTYHRTLRINQRKRAFMAGREWVEPDPLPATEEGVRNGARQIVVGSINSAKRRGRIEQFEQDGRQFFRKGRDPHVPTHEELSERARKGNASMTWEERSERSRRSWERLTPEERSERARHAVAGVSKEVQSAKAKTWWDRATPEQRAERARRVSEGIHRSSTPEERSERRKHHRTRRDPEEWRRKITESWSKLTPEERSARAKKGVETRRRRAWFREGADRKGEDVPTRPEGGVQPDQHGREGGTAQDHAQPLGGFVRADE